MENLKGIHFSLFHFKKFHYLTAEDRSWEGENMGYKRKPCQLKISLHSSKINSPSDLP